VRCWAPRGLAIASIAFLSVFALDVFGEGRGAVVTAVVRLIHLVPSLALAAVLALAWRREWIGTLFLGPGRVGIRVVGAGQGCAATRYAPAPVRHRPGARVPRGRALPGQLAGTARARGVVPFAVCAAQSARNAAAGPRLRRSESA
jgi:hypothetical protein